MPIAINSEHNDLADSVRSLVAKVAPPEVLHEALETPISNPPPYWKAAAEQGLQGVHLAEEVGGQGFGILELAITLAEFGYGAVPGPFVPSAIAGALISAHDTASPLLAPLASGETIAAYAIDSGLTATRQGEPRSCASNPNERGGGSVATSGRRRNRSVSASSSSEASHPSYVPIFSVISSPRCKFCHNVPTGTDRLICSWLPLSLPS